MASKKRWGVAGGWGGQKEEEHLLLSCGAGEEPASTVVVSEAGHRAFVSSCCHSLGEATSHHHPSTHPPSPLNPPRPCGTSFTSCCAESVTHCSPGGRRPRLKRGFNSALVRTLLSNARAVIGFNDSDAELFKCFQRPKLIAIRSTPNRCVLLLMIDFQTTETAQTKKN